MIGKGFGLILVGLAVISTANGIYLSFSARNLPSMDPFSGAPDAYVTVYYAGSSTSPYENRGETAYSLDNRNPDWQEVFDIPNNGNIGQMLKFDLYDADDDADDYMGYVEIMYSEILNDSDGVLIKNIVGGSPGGGQFHIKRQSLKKSKL